MNELGRKKLRPDEMVVTSFDAHQRRDFDFSCKEGLHGLLSHLFAKRAELRSTIGTLRIRPAAPRELLDEVRSMNVHDTFLNQAVIDIGAGYLLNALTNICRPFKLGAYVAQGHGQTVRFQVGIKLQALSATRG